VDRLEAELTDHPDRGFVAYLVNGFRHGFDTGVVNPPTQPLECRNLLSARQDPDFVTLAVHDECQQGYLWGPFTIPPFENYRVSPVGVAIGKYSGKKRLIVDLSSPHDNAEHDSINDLIDKKQFSLTYIRIEDAISKIREFGASTWLTKTDICAAYKQVPIAKRLWHLYGIKWKNQYYFYKVLAFGSRSSPKIFDHLSTAICWLLQNKYNVEFVLHLIDDFLAIDRPDVIAERTMAIFISMFHRLKVPLALNKTTGPVHELEFLGVVLDTVNMEARLPQNKLDRIVEFLQSMLHKHSCTKRELLSLLGHLNFACRVIVPGRSFVSYLISLAYTVTELHHRVKLTAECRADINMWFLFLRDWNGISFFLESSVTEAEELQLYTDAASTIGFGGYFQGHWFQGKWPSEFAQVHNYQLSMALMELYPIVIAAMIWGKVWGGKRIHFYCDNAATVHIINKGRSKVAAIMKLMRRLTWCAAKGNFVVRSSHVPGKLNCISDSLSRFQQERFRSLAVDADLEPAACPQLSEVVMN
jgi:hypothetical protein